MQDHQRVSYGAYLSYLRLKMDAPGGIFASGPSWIDALSPVYDEDTTVVGTDTQLTEEVLQMMFVSGETGEPSAETTTIIEGIVQQQVIEMVRRDRFVLFLQAMEATISSRTRAKSLPLVDASNRSRCEARGPQHFYRRSHLPYPPRQSQSVPSAHILVLERCP